MGKLGNHNRLGISTGTTFLAKAIDSIDCSLGMMTARKRTAETCPKGTVRSPSVVLGRGYCLEIGPLELGKTKTIEVTSSLYARQPLTLSTKATK